MAAFSFLEDDQQLGSYYVAISIAVITIYEIVMTKIRGQTLGKMLARIRVVKARDGTLPGWGASIIRYAVPSLAVWLIEVAMSLLGRSDSFWVVFLLPAFYLTAALDRQRRGLHDKAAGTIVVSARTVPGD